MKNLLIALLLTISYASYGQGFFIKHANEINGRENVSNIFVSNDKLYVLGSSMSHPDIFENNDKPHFHSFNVNSGTLLNDHIYYTDDTLSYSVRHTILADNIFYNVGVVRNGEFTDDYDYLLLIYDTEQIDTLIRFGNPDKFDRLNGIALDSKQNIITAGIIRKGTVQAKGEITKFSDTHELLWSRVLDPDFAFEYRVSSVTTDDQDNIYGLATAWLNGTRNISISKFSSQGDSLWTKLYPIGEFSVSDEIKTTAEGDLLVSGGAYLETTGGAIVNSPIFMKVDTAGEMLWIQNYRLDVGGYAYQSKYIQLDDGGFARVYSGFGYPTLLVADKDGNVEYTKHYDQFDVIFPNDLKQLEDGSFVMVGYINSNLNPEGHTMWLLKTDIEGNVTVSTLQTKNIGDIVVYPNPTTDYINVKTDVLSSGTLSYKIVDATGRVVTSTTSSQINVSHLSQGNYFVNIFSKGQFVEAIPFIIY